MRTIEDGSLGLPATLLGAPGLPRGLSGSAGLTWAPLGFPLIPLPLQGSLRLSQARDVSMSFVSSSSAL